jgi:LacI family transcriptional regulator
VAKLREIAVILNTESMYPRNVLGGIVSYAREAKTWCLYVEDEPPEEIPDLRTLQRDGIIMSFPSRRVSRIVRDLKVPVVGIEGGYCWYDSASRVPYFATDNEAIGRLAAEYFITQGFTRLAYSGYPPGRMTPWSIQRADAFQQRAEESGLPCAIHVNRRGAAGKQYDLRKGLDTWLRSLEKPVGLLAANDVLARHILEACLAADIRVPEEVAVLGVDNDKMMCELAVPPLSSIEQDARGLGYQAAALLDRLMAGAKAKSLKTLVEPVGVVARRSTDILAITDPDVGAALAFIHARACDPICVADVVASVQVSRSVLDARFKGMIGRTIHAEIQRVQIERARSLLATTDWPIKQVAAQAGFANIPYLTTLFRTRTGWTPAAYRKHARL